MTEQRAIPSFSMLAPHLRARHELIKLHRWNETREEAGQVEQLGKVPFRGWRSAKPLSESEVRGHMGSGGNIGVRLRSTDLVIDIDPRNFPHGRNPFREMCAALDMRAGDWPHVQTGGGGIHYYLCKPEDVSIVGQLHDYPGVEFKTAGNQVLAAGCVHPATRAYYAVDPINDSLDAPPQAPQTLLDAITRSSSFGSTTDGAGIAPELLGELLAGLEPRDFQDQKNWQDLMMSAHHATGGLGVEEFIAWSTADPEYAEQGPTIRRRWKSLDPQRPGAITAATLYKALQDAGRLDLVERAKIAESKNDFDDGLIQPEGTKAAIRQVVEEWVWVADAARFIRCSDLKKYKPDQWKSMFANLKPDGDVLNAVWKGNIGIRKFESLVYLPGAPEILSRDDNSQYNLWRPSGIDAKPGDSSWFTRHLDYLFPNSFERDLVLDYLAVLVQRPAEKMHFALLVRGAQGTGKSAIGEVMRRIIGERNVVKPSNDEVNGKFTAWQEGAQLAIIEELMMLGRLEVANRLKPVITDPQLRIEEKYGNPYSIPNHMNLLCFTNHRDALKIETGDRRWLVIFSPAKKNSEAYYKDLFERIRSDESAGAVKHLLLRRSITLNPKGPAPETRAKDEMRRLSMGEVEAHLLELFENDEPPFDFDLVRNEDVVDALPPEIARRHAENLSATVAKFLQDEIGAIQHTRRTKDGDAPSYRLWSIRNHDEWATRGATARIEAYIARRPTGLSDE